MNKCTRKRSQAATNSSLTQESRTIRRPVILSLHHSFVCFINLSVSPFIYPSIRTICLDSSSLCTKYLAFISSVILQEHQVFPENRMQYRGIPEMHLIHDDIQPLNAVFLANTKAASDLPVPKGPRIQPLFISLITCSSIN